MTNQVDNLNAAVGLLSQVKGSFSPSLQSLIENQKVSVHEASDYIKLPISGQGGEITIVEPGTKRIDGVSTFQGNSFPQNVGKMVDAIRIATGKGDPAKLGDVKFDLAAPAQLLNANLTIKQNGRTLLDKKVSDFIPAGTETSSNELYLPLALPMILKDVEEFDIKLRFPKSGGLPTVALDADTINVDVSFRSFETSRKAS